MLAPRPPSPTEAIGAYRTVDAWVRAWELPGVDAPTPLERLAGAAVVLRLNGEVIGRGSETRAEAPGGPNPLVAAARAALAEAARRVPVENDALREERTRQLASDVTISLELAGDLIPIRARTFDEAAAGLNPGLDGVAARIGSRLAAIFPSAMLTQSMSPRLALSSVASQAANDPALGLSEMDVLTEKHGVRFYRFRVTHLAQGTPGSAPAFLYRGGRVVGLTEITGQELRDMADRIAEHFLTRDWPGAEPYGMMGTYDPCRNAHDPRVAAPVEQLTACLALVRYATLLGPGTPRAGELVRFVDDTLGDLADVEHGEPDASNEPAAASAWVVVAGERAALPDAPQLPAEFDEQCRRTVLGAYRMDTGYAGAVPAPAQPLVALALVHMARLEKQGRMRDEAVMLADSAIRSAFRTASPGELVARMPFLGWAELDLASLRGEEQIGSRTGLRDMRTQVWEHQVQATDPAASDATGAGGGPDMLGGIVFDTARAAGTPLPTWQTARPIAFIATMLADERLTPKDDRPLELARLVSGLRFLRQLQMDEGSAWMCESPRKSLGGIRSAPWDQRMPSDASAMVLLSLCEAIKGLEVMVGR